jgi:hypothetical protein
MFAVAAPPVAAVILLAALAPGLGESRAVIAMVTGHILALALTVGANLRVWPLHFLETAGVVFVVSLVVMASGGRGQTAIEGGWRGSWRGSPRALKWASALIVVVVGLTVLGFA